MENVCLKRCSCRSFLKKEIPEEMVERLLRAAMQAPSALNEQPWEFLLISDSGAKARVAEISPNYKPAAGAACLILLLADRKRIKKDSPWWVQDMSACAENILIQAVELGLGAVWLGVYPRKERIEALKELAELPEEVVPFALIAVGYPAEELHAAVRYEEGRIHRERYTKNI